jgi:hypothetical protein
MIYQRSLDLSTLALHKAGGSGGVGEGEYGEVLTIEQNKIVYKEEVIKNSYI